MCQEPASRTITLALAMFTLHQTEWCPHSHRVRQRLTELSVDFIAKQVPARREDRADLRRATGTDRVPVLITDEGALLEGSDQILVYLAQRFDEPADARVHRAKAHEHVPTFSVSYPQKAAPPSRVFADGALPSSS